MRMLSFPPTRSFAGPAHTTHPSPSSCSLEGGSSFSPDVSSHALEHKAPETCEGVGYFAMGHCAFWGFWEAGRSDHESLKRGLRREVRGDSAVVQLVWALGVFREGSPKLSC